MNYNDLELAVKSVWSLLPSEKKLTVVKKPTDNLLDGLATNRGTTYMPAFVLYPY